MNHFNLYFLAHGLLLSSIYHGNSVLAEKDSGVVDPFGTTPERELLMTTTSIESDGSMKMMTTPTEFLSPLRIINASPTTNATTIAGGGALLAMNETNDASDTEFRPLTRSNSAFPGFVPTSACSYNKNIRRVTGCGNTVGAIEFCGITTDDVKSANKVNTYGTCYKKKRVESAFNECVNDLVGNKNNNSCKGGYCKDGTCVPYLKTTQKCTVFDRNSPDFECAEGLRCARKRGTSFGKCKSGKPRSLHFAEEL